MANYPELPCAVIKNVGGVKHFVRRYGLNRVVLEEELIPIPAEKVVRTMKADGTEDITKRISEQIK